MRSINDIIEIAQVSEYLCSVDIARKGLYGGGIDLQLPLKINNIRKSVQWVNDHNPVTGHRSIAYLILSTVGDVGDVITVEVNDESYGGIISLGSYQIQPSDTTVEDLAQNLAGSLNYYGYVISYVAPDIVKIESHLIEPASVNGDNLIVDPGGNTDYSIIQFAGGINPYDVDQELRNIANYLYALCAPYNVKAASIIGIVEPNVNARAVVLSSIISPIRITSEDFVDATHWDGQNSVNQTVLGSYRLQVFANFIARYLTEGTEWERTASGINILLDGFDALSNEYEFYIDISA